MKTLFLAAMAGWLLSMSPAMSLAQGTALSNEMPSVPPAKRVRYRYVYTKSGSNATTDSGYVDLAHNPTTLYYRECHGNQECREVLYNRDTHQVLLFNQLQNRLDVFSQLPHNAMPFIPLPFQDEAIARIVELAPVRNLIVHGKATTVSFPGTLSKSMGSVPVQFRAELTPMTAGTKVKTFSIQSPDGAVASWAFIYNESSTTPALPTIVTRLIASPIMTPDDRARYQRHEAVPLTHWRPEARVAYTFVEDRPGGEDAVPSGESFLRRANEQTMVVDRRDVKNVVRFRYRKAGGDLEKQIAAAHLQGESSVSDTLTTKNWLNAGGYALLAPFILGTFCLVGGIWSVLWRRSRPDKTQIS